jgi:formiminoglutamate deiminase
VAEQRAEVDDCLAWSGQRPVRWLLDHAGVDARGCLVHATHVDDEELRSLAATGATVGLCPVTEANLGDGVFPAQTWLDSGGRFGIGSDSNVRICAAEELRMLEYGQRLTQRRRTVLADAATRSTGRRLHAGALSGGDRALGVAASGLTVGGCADLVTLDVGHPSMVARRGDATLDSWVFAAGAAAIDCVWCHGHKMVVGGRHVRGPEIAARYRRCLESLLA